MERLGAVTQRLGKGARADGKEHEFLKVHVVGRVRAAIEHIHHRRRQDERSAGFAAVKLADVRIERDARIQGGGAANRH